MSEAGDGFFSRWSRRKSQARVVEPGLVPPAESAALHAGGLQQARAGTSPQPGPGAAPAPAAGLGPASADAGNASETAPPTLDDVAALTRESDFSRYARRDLDPQVRNAAMRKLFASEPSFNVMDGLDVYIDDYSKGESIPKAMLRQMVQARVLGLLDDDLTDQDKPPPEAVENVPRSVDTPQVHENPDLQLQRDDAAGPGCAEPGAGGDPGSAQSERPGTD